MFRINKSIKNISKRQYTNIINTSKTQLTTFDHVLGTFICVVGCAGIINGIKEGLKEGYKSIQDGNHIGQVSGDTLGKFIEGFIYASIVTSAFPLTGPLYMTNYVEKYLEKPQQGHVHSVRDSTTNL